MSRQQIRWTFFRAALAFVAQEFKGEPRRARRNIARALAKQTWRDRLTKPEPPSTID